MIPQLVHVLARNPLLLLFLVAAVGYPLGRLRVRGSPIGVAAVLFVGLVAGGLDASLALPEIVYMLGLAIFVYTVGLSSGRAFAASLRRDGLRLAALAAGSVTLAAASPSPRRGSSASPAPTPPGCSPARRPTRRRWPPRSRP